MNSLASAILSNYISPESEAHADALAAMNEFAIVIGAPRPCLFVSELTDEEIDFTFAMKGNFHTFGTVDGDTVAVVSAADGRCYVVPPQFVKFV
jgi:hypothetical protein